MAKFITIKNLSGWRKNRPIFNQLVFDRKLIKLIEIIYSFELLGVKSPFSSVALLVYCPFNYTLTAVDACDRCRCLDRCLSAQFYAATTNKHLFTKLAKTLFIE